LPRRRLAAADLALRFWVWCIGKIHNRKLWLVTPWNATLELFRRA
jgi:hypothetical protein